jgi:Flp pilus assembly protein TadG
MRGFRRSEQDSGQILILTALSMTVLLGIAALSIDACYMFDKRNRLHAAADAAAKTGALEVQRDLTISNTVLQAFANQQVAAHGFNPSGPTNVVVNHPPSTGPFAGNVGYVEAIVSERTNTFFGVVLGITSMNPTARAVAGSAPGSNCIVTLGGPTLSPPAASPAGGESLNIGNSTINAPTCSIADDGDLNAYNPNSLINSLGVGVTGACIGTCPQPNQGTGVPPTADPLAGVLSPPANPGGCTAVSVANNATLSLPSGNHCYSSITLGNNSNLYLASGIYYVTGPITTGNSPRICLNATCVLDYSNGVTIYMTGAGSINLPNGTTMALNAQTSGPYNGILFYQDPLDTNPATFRNGSSDYNLSGAMYFPSADLTLGNASSANDCALLVARSVTMQNGTSQLANTCSQYGGSPILTVSIAE